MNQPTPKIPLSRAILQSLQFLGIKHIITVPGTQLVPIIDAARHQSFPKLIVATNELDGGFIACGTSLSSPLTVQEPLDIPGVILTIPGPGFLYALPAIAEADADSIPLLVIMVKPQMSTHEFALHNLAHAEIAKPLLRAHFTLGNSGDVLSSITRAFSATLSEEPGPVLLEIAQEILNDTVDSLECEIQKPSKAEGDTTVVAQKLSELISTSARPLFILGKGATRASSAVRTLAQRSTIPCISTASGRGVIADSSSLCFTKDFSSGIGDTIPKLIEAADRVFVFGAKLTHNGTAGFELILPPEKLVRVDKSSAVLSANYPSPQSFVGDCGKILNQLPTITGLASYRSSWESKNLQALQQSRLREIAKALNDEPKIATTQLQSVAEFFKQLQSALPGKRIFVTDSGLHQALARQYLEISHPGELLIPADLQTMGFGLPVAIGAALAQPESQVVAIVGDGAFCASGLELLTAIDQQLSLLVVVLDDGAYGLIRRQLRQESGSDFLVTRHTPNLRLFASSLDIEFFDLMSENPSEIINSAIAARGVRMLRVPLSDTMRTSLKSLGAGIKDRVRRAFGTS